MEKTFEELTATEKSSLGAELITNGDMELDASWGTQNTPSTEEQSNDYAYSGSYSWHVITDGGDEGISSASYTTVTGTLYKVNLWIYAINLTELPNITIREGDGSGTAATLAVRPTVTEQWTEFTGYYTETSGGSSADMAIRSNAGANWYIDNVSVKAVTHDLVSYWALDEDFDSASLVIDKVNNTFGDNIIPDDESNLNNTTGYWTLAQGTGGGSVTLAGDGSLVMVNAQDGKLYRDGTLTANTLYKVTLNITAISGTDMRFRIFNGGSIDEPEKHGYGTPALGEFVFYFRTGTGTSFTLLMDNTTNGTLGSVKVQPYNGNMGALL